MKMNLTSTSPPTGFFLNKEDPVWFPPRLYFISKLNARHAGGGAAAMSLGGSLAGCGGAGDASSSFSACGGGGGGGFAGLGGRGGECLMCGACGSALDVIC